MITGWEQLNARCEDLMTQCYADSTLETKTAQLQKYSKFCTEFKDYLKPIPCKSKQVALYVSYLVKTLKYSSIKGYVSALSIYLQSIGEPAIDYNNYKVYAAMRGARRMLGDQPKQAAPILPHHILGICAHLTGNPGHVTFRAAMLLSFRALLRKQHVTLSNAHLLREDITIQDWGMMVRVSTSKTIQFKQKVLVIPVSRVPDERLCAVHWVERHLKQAPAPQKAPLFMNPGPAGLEGLSYDTYQSTLRLMCKRAGLNPEDFSSHSMRRGGTTYLGMIGIPVQDIKVRGDWSSDCVLQYLKTPIDVLIQQDVMVAAMIARTARQPPPRYAH